MDYPRRCPQCRSKVPLAAGGANRIGETVFTCPSCGARLRDLGEKRMFPAALILIALASVLGVFSPTAVLIVCVPAAILLWRWVFAFDVLSEQRAEPSK